MNSLPRAVGRFLKLVLATSIALTTASPAAYAAAPLASRLSTIDSLNSKFLWLRYEEEKLILALAEHSPCRTDEVRSQASITDCLSKSQEVIRRTNVSRRLISEILLAATTTEAQPVPDSLGTKLQALKDNFNALEAIEDRLEKEKRNYEIHNPEPRSFTCDEVVQRAKSVRRGTIVVDPKFLICEAVRISSIRELPKTSFLDAHVAFDEDEGVHISKGDDPEGPGNEESGCSGAACTGEGSRGGGGEPRGEGGERRSAFNPDLYNHEKVREWAEGKSNGDRPVPLDDEQIMALERDRFEKDSGAKAWPVVEATTPVVSSANSVLEQIPAGNLYRQEPLPASSPAHERIDVQVVSEIPDQNAIQLRLGLTRLRLDSAQPETPQQREAKAIASGAIDEGYEALEKGDLEEAEHSTTLAEGMTDLALGLTPGVSWAKDVFEAVTGKNLVTGETLNGFERSLAIFGAATVGLGSKAGTAIKALSRLSKFAKSIGKLDHAYVAAEKIARTAIRIGVRSKAEAKEFVDFSRRAFGNEIGAVGDGVERLVQRLGLKKVEQIWTRTKERTPFTNATRHFEDHIEEFPGLKTFDDYVVATYDFVRNPPSGTLKKVRDKDLLFYHEASNTFAVVTENFTPKTMFKPKEFIEYWKKQAGKEIL